MQCWDLALITSCSLLRTLCSLHEATMHFYSFPQALRHDGLATVRNVSIIQYKKLWRTLFQYNWKWGNILETQQLESRKFWDIACSCLIFQTFLTNWYITWSLCQWTPYHQGMGLTQDADGEDGLQIRRVAVNILNKESRTADKGWLTNWVLDGGVTTPHCKKTNIQNLTLALE